MNSDKGTSRTSFIFVNWERVYLSDFSKRIKLEFYLYIPSNLYMMHLY